MKRRLQIGFVRGPEGAGGNAAHGERPMLLADSRLLCGLRPFRRGRALGGTALRDPSLVFRRYVDRLASWSKRLLYGADLRPPHVVNRKWTWPVECNYKERREI